MPPRAVGAHRAAGSVAAGRTCAPGRSDGSGKACFAANSLRLAALRRVPLSERSKLLLNSQQLTKYLFSGT